MVGVEDNMHAIRQAVVKSLFSSLFEFYAHEVARSSVDSCEARVQDLSTVCSASEFAKAVFSGRDIGVVPRRRLNTEGLAKLMILLVVATDRILWEELRPDLEMKLKVPL